MVFKATHLEMNRPVALKTLLPQAAMESVEVERFRQEAVLASVQSDGDVFIEPPMDQLLSGSSQD